MNFKKILVIFMTLAMLITTFAPTLGVFAEELQKENSKTEINYVSVGDSMSNGLGMDGYIQSGNGGYLAVAPEAYPSQFAAWLAGYDGEVEVELGVAPKKYVGDNGTVNLYQLATSGARAEDLYYMLTLGTEDEFEADPWTVDHFGKEGDPWYGKSDEIKATIANADIISYALGNGNFGVFLLNKIADLVGFNEYDEEVDEEAYAHYNLENALILLEADEDLTKLVNDIYDDVIAYCVEADLPVELIEQFADYVAYTAASYLVTFVKTVDLIEKMNPDVEFMFVPLINNAHDFDIDFVSGESKTTINVGEIISALYTPINAYIASYLTIKQMDGEYSDLTFYYAKLPVDENGEEIQVEMFAQAFEPLYVEVVKGEEYPATRLFCHSRFIKDVRSFIFEKIFDNRGVYFNEYDVQKYEMAKVNGPEALAAEIEAYPERAEWIELYLGIIDSILNAIKSSAKIDTTKVGDLNFDDFSIFDLLEPAKVNLMNRIKDEALNRADAELIEALKNLGYSPETARNYAAISNTGDACYDELLDEGMVQALFALYGRSLLANGLAGHTSQGGHKTIAQSLISAYENEFTMSDEAIEIVKDMIKLLIENYDLAYEIAYKYVDGEGYIDDSVESLYKLIDALNRVISEVESDLTVVSDDLKAQILVELNAAIDTLNEIRAILAEDKASTVVGLGASILALKDDFNTHINNASAIAAQAGIDVSIAIEAAKEIFVEETLPALIKLTEEYAWVAVDFLLSNIDVIYYNFPAIVDGVYAHVIEKALWIQIIVGEAVDYATEVAVEAYFVILDTLVDVYGTLEVAVAEADKVIHEIYVTLVEMDENLGYPSKDVLGMTVVECAELFNSIYYLACEKGVDALELLKATLIDISKQANVEYANAVVLYNSILKTLIAAGGEAENVMIVGSQIFSYMADFVIEDLTLAELKSHCDNIVDLVAETYRGTKDLDAVGNEIYAYTVEIFADTFEGDYLLTKDSLYIALGNAPYGEELAEMLHLEEKYYNFALDEEYTDLLCDADFITIQFNNGEMIDFALEQVLNYGTELDWDKHLDDEGKDALDKVLDSLRAQLIASGVAEDLSSTLRESMGEYLEAFAGAGIDIRDELVADALTYMAECLIYAYADLIDRIEITLDTVYAEAPDATVVITGMESSLSNLGLDDFGVDISEYTDILDQVIDVFNLQLIAIAFAHENTIYVDSSDAADIYAALNIACAHDYDDCEDDTCNICGATRVAPGHKYGEWCVVKEADIGVEGREERTCSECGHVDARSIDALPVPPANDLVEEEEPKNNTALIIGIIVGVVVLAIAGITYYKKKKAPTSASNEENADADKE